MRGGHRLFFRLRRLQNRSSAALGEHRPALQIDRGLENER
jgi:hypothetical protein